MFKLKLLIERIGWLFYAAWYLLTLRQAFYKYVIQDRVSGLYLSNIDEKDKEYDLNTSEFLITDWKPTAEKWLKEVKEYQVFCDRPEDYYKPELEIVKIIGIYITE